MRFLWVWLGMTGLLIAAPLCRMDGNDLQLPLKDYTIEKFIDNSIGHEPSAIVEDGLPHFGAKRDDFKGKNRTHKGIDIYDNHVEVIASADGEVVEVVRGKLSGIYIKLLHANGLETLYIHLTDVYVKAGEWVKAGETIARIDGSSGNAVAPQLHYEIKRNRKDHIDPIGCVLSYYNDAPKVLERINQARSHIPDLIEKRDALVRQRVAK